jgi:hypothetical protein
MWLHVALNLKLIRYFSKVNWVMYPVRGFRVYLILFNVVVLYAVKYIHVLIKYLINALHYIQFNFKILQLEIPTKGNTTYTLV